MKNIPKIKRYFTDMIESGRIFSMLLLLAFFVLVLSSIFVNPKLYQQRMHEGDIALRDTFAPYDFSYSWGIDIEKTQKAREAAGEAAPCYLNASLNVSKEVESVLTGALDLLEKVSEKNKSLQDKISLMKKDADLSLSDKVWKVLLEYPDKEKLSKGSRQVLENIFKIGFISNDDLKLMGKSKVEEIVLYDENTGKTIEKVKDDIITERTLPLAVENSAQWFLDEDENLKNAVVALIEEIIKPNVSYSEEKTAEMRMEQEKEVKPFYNVWTVKKNEIIIEKGERVKPRHVAQFSKINDILKSGKSRKFFIGTVLLLLILGFFGAIYLTMIRLDKFFSQPRDLSIILINMLLMVIATNAIMKLPQPSYFIPLSSMSMMLMLLVGFNLAFISVVLMSVYIAVISGGQASVAFVLLAGSMVGIFAIKGARRRASILWAGLLVGVAKAFAVISFGLISGTEASIFLKDAVSGVSSGVISGLLVMGILPLFEYVFKVPTNISLLEISDLNHPVLKRLAMVAPGTYHHSIMVGNLAESACDRINANSLLARVGAYYHDIGKISKPQYFSENEMGEKSKHTGLTPSMSALIISNHVKEGVELARKHKLNDTIIDFIREHHGDSLIAYFYQKALEKNKNGDTPDEKNFRYPGPRPQTKEAAIVLLADAVEASSRSLSEPTPSSIKHLVRKVINNKFIDGQLDGCELTLRDMHDISDSFVRALMGIFHTRTSYPENGRQTNKMNK